MTQNKFTWTKLYDLVTTSNAVINRAVPADKKIIRVVGCSNFERHKTKAPLSARHKWDVVADPNYECLNGSEISISGPRFQKWPRRVSDEISIGRSINGSHEASSLYAEVSGRTALADFGNSYAIKGRVGFRMRF